VKEKEKKKLIEHTHTLQTRKNKFKNSDEMEPANLELQRGDLVREFSNALGLLSVPDPHHHQLLLHLSNHQRT
jgi:hypothetical protein